MVQSTMKIKEIIQLTEKAPPDPQLEKWIKDNKEKFIDQYGEEEGLKILYATAWKMHKKN